MECGSTKFLVGLGIGSAIGALVYHFSRTAKAKKLKNDVFNALREIEADAETVMQITGFAPGGVCPFALRQQVSVYLDNSLKEYDITFIAAGTPHSALPISAEMLEKVTGGSWVDATK